MTTKARSRVQMYKRQDRVLGAWNLGGKGRGQEKNSVLQRCQQ